MISPDTALFLAPLEASSAFSADFAGEPDPSHNGLLAAFALRFEAVLFFAALDFEASVFLALPFKASFFFVLLRGGCSHGSMFLLFLRRFRGCHFNKSVIVTR